MDTRNTKPVILATIVGMGLLLGSIVVSNRIDSPFAGQTEPERSMPDRQTIATGEAPGQRMQTWQDELLDTRPQRSYITVDETGEYVVPERDPNATLTGRFGVSLVEEILLSDGEDVDAAINRVVENIINETRDELYVVEDLQLTRTNDDAIKTYFNEAAETLQRHGIQNETNEMRIFSQALRTNDPDTYARLLPIAATYGDMRDALLELTVPTRYYETHLNLINTFNMLHNGLTDMAHTEEDPLRAYVRYQRYPDDMYGLSMSMVSMAMHVVKNDGLFDYYDTATFFFNYLPDQFISS